MNQTSFFLFVTLSLSCQNWELNLVIHSWYNVTKGI